MGRGRSSGGTQRPAPAAKPLAVGPVAASMTGVLPPPLPRDKARAQKSTQAMEGPVAAAALRSRVLELALEAEGSREVQRTLDVSPGAEQEILIRELRGHISRALQSPHGNHVLQKAIAVMWPSDLCFIVPELLQWGQPSTLAKHPYGCRVLERLIEFFPAKWLDQFLGDLLECVSELSKHQYGNFVVQHLLEHGEKHVRRKIVSVVCDQLASMATNQHACSVVDKALTYADMEDRQRLIGKVLDRRGLLVNFATKRWGMSTAERLLSLAKGSQRDEANNQILDNMAAMQRTVSGRQLLEMIASDLQPSLEARLQAGGSSSPLEAFAFGGAGSQPRCSRESSLASAAAEPLRSGDSTPAPSIGRTTSTVLILD